MKIVPVPLLSTRFRSKGKPDDHGFILNDATRGDVFGIPVLIFRHGNREMNLLRIAEVMKDLPEFEGTSTETLTYRSLEEIHEIIASAGVSINKHELKMHLEHLVRVGLISKYYPAEIEMYGFPLIENNLEREGWIERNGKTDPVHVGTVSSQLSLMPDSFVQDLEDRGKKLTLESTLELMMEVKQNILGIMVLHNQSQVPIIVKKFKDHLFSDEVSAASMFFVIMEMARILFNSTNDMPETIEYSSGKEAAIIHGMHVTVIVLFNGTVPRYIKEKIGAEFIPRFESKYFHLLIKNGIKDSLFDKTVDLMMDLLLPIKEIHDGGRVL
ncbi:hypothetical protein GF325_03145 [Candidatus Bathyarchaeota archaeon]|nr:hypothetical protein [Candidatus Bathyarchaeota archaeon]